MWGVQHVEYWVTSDGRTFPTEEEANNWQEFLDRNESNGNTYYSCNDFNGKKDNDDNSSTTEMLKRIFSDIKL